MVKDATYVADKWRSNLKGSTDAMRKGVDGVTVAPSKKAIESKEKMKRNLIEAIDSGKWEDGLKAVSLDDWKTAMDKGINRVGTGADASVGKVESFMKDFLPHLEEGKKKVDAMPNVTLEDNIARAEAMIRHNAQYKRKR